jgi:hypothetical protein
VITSASADGLVVESLYNVGCEELLLAGFKDSRLAWSIANGTRRYAGMSDVAGLATIFYFSCDSDALADAHRSARGGRCGFINLLLESRGSVVHGRLLDVVATKLKGQCHKAQN